MGRLTSHIYDQRRLFTAAADDIALNLMECGGARGAINY